MHNVFIEIYCSINGKSKVLILHFNKNRDPDKSRWMSFGFVRRYVQRHGRSETFTTLLSTQSYGLKTPPPSPTKILSINELDTMIPPISRPESPESLASKMKAHLKLEPVILGKSSKELINRPPSPIKADSLDQRRPFSEILKSKELVRKLAEMGIVHPTSIQSLIIDKWQASKSDLMIKAHTGTGKSFGYLLTLLEKRVVRDVSSDTLESPNIIMVPNDLLALQIKEWVERLAGPGIAQVLGSNEQAETIGYFHLIITTPKALLQRLSQGALKIDTIRTIILDEADALIKPLPKHATPKERQNRKKHPVPAITALCQIRDRFEAKQKPKPRILVLSASLGGRTKDLLRNLGLVSRENSLFLEDDVEKRSVECPSSIKHHHRLLTQFDDLEEMARQIFWIQQENQSKLGVVFTDADQSKQQLKVWIESHGIEVGLLSDKTDNATLLLGSDSDARGLDLPELEYVILVGVPKSATSYLHVAGRVGRMGRPGSVYTLLNNQQELEGYLGIISRLGLNSHIITATPQPLSSA